MEHELESALSKLRWSASGGEWSATIKPGECRALLAAFGTTALRIGTIDKKINSGDPGDEQS